MAENETVKVPTEVPEELKNIKITRNEVVKELTPMPFGKKSDNFGKFFVAPVLTLANWENDVKWVGQDEVFDGLNRSLRTIFADIYVDNIDENTGILNMEAFLADCADFSAGVAKLDEINEQLDELQGIQQTYAFDENFGATVDGTDKTPLTEAAQQLQQKITEVARKINPLRAKREVIKAKYAVRAEKRAAKKAAKEAAAEKAKGSSPVVA